MAIPLREIQWIDVRDGSGSFDLIVKANGKRVHFHRIIENQMEKNRQLIRYLKSKKINVRTFDPVD